MQKAILCVNHMARLSSLILKVADICNIHNSNKTDCLLSYNKIKMKEFHILLHYHFETANEQKLFWQNRLDKKIDTDRKNKSY